MSRLPRSVKLWLLAKRKAICAYPVVWLRSRSKFDLFQLSYFFVDYLFMWLMRQREVPTARQCNILYCATADKLFASTPSMTEK